MINDFISVNDELQELKRRMKKAGKDVIRIDKVGNGNMSAFRILYKEDDSETVHDNFFWRHDMENFLQKIIGTIS